ISKAMSTKHHKHGRRQELVNIPIDTTNSKDTLGHILISRPYDRLPSGQIIRAIGLQWEELYDKICDTTTFPYK
ncbi:unnamed protein product, partial [Ilex paraguariensis]